MQNDAAGSRERSSCSEIGPLPSATISAGVHRLSMQNTHLLGPSFLRGSLAFLNVPVAPINSSLGTSEPTSEPEDAAELSIGSFDLEDQSLLRSSESLLKKIEDRRGAVHGLLVQRDLDIAHISDQLSCAEVQLTHRDAKIADLTRLLDDSMQRENALVRSLTESESSDNASKAALSRTEEVVASLRSDLSASLRHLSEQEAVLLVERSRLDRLMKESSELTALRSQFLALEAESSAKTQILQQLEAEVVALRRTCDRLSLERVSVAPLPQGDFSQRRPPPSSSWPDFEAGLSDSEDDEPVDLRGLDPLLLDSSRVLDRLMALQSQKSSEGRERDLLLSHLLQKSDSLEEELKSRSEELEQSLAQTKNLQRQLKMHSEETDAQSQRREALEVALLVMQDQKAEIQMELAAATVSLEQAVRQHSRLEEELRLVREEAQESIGKAIALEERLAAASSRAETLPTADELQGVLTKLQEAESSLNVERSRSSRLEGSVVSLAEEIESLKRALETAQQQRQDATSAVQKIWEEISDESEADGTAQRWRPDSDGCELLSDSDCGKDAAGSKDSDVILRSEELLRRLREVKQSLSDSERETQLQRASLSANGDRLLELLVFSAEAIRRLEERLGATESEKAEKESELQRQNGLHEKELSDLQSALTTEIEQHADAVASYEAQLMGSQMRSTDLSDEVKRLESELDRQRSGFAEMEERSSTASELGPTGVLVEETVAEADRTQVLLQDRSRQDQAVQADLNPEDDDSAEGKDATLTVPMIGTAPLETDQWMDRCVHAEELLSQQIHLNATKADEIAQLMERLRDLEINRTSLEQSLNEERQAQKDQADRLQKLNDSLSTADVQKLELASKVEELESLVASECSKSEELIHRNEEQQQETEMLVHECEEKEAELLQDHQRLSELSSNCAQYRDRCESNSAEKDSFLHEIADLRQVIAEEERKIAELEATIKRQKRSHSGQVQSLESEVALLRQGLAAQIEFRDQLECTLLLSARQAVTTPKSGVDAFVSASASESHAPVSSVTGVHTESVACGSEEVAGPQSPSMETAVSQLAVEELGSSLLLLDSLLSRQTRHSERLRSSMDAYSADLLVLLADYRLFGPRGLPWQESAPPPRFCSPPADPAIVSCMVDSLSSPKTVQERARAVSKHDSALPRCGDTAVALDYSTPNSGAALPEMIRPLEPEEEEQTQSCPAFTSHGAPRASAPIPPPGSAAAEKNCQSVESPKSKYESIQYLFDNIEIFLAEESKQDSYPYLQAIIDTFDFLKSTFDSQTTQIDSLRGLIQGHNRRV